MKKTTFFLLALMGIVSLTLPAKTTVIMKKAGELKSELTPIQIDTCTSLTVIGPLNSDDIQLLRRMGGAADESQGKGKLRILDLRQAVFQNDKNPYMALDMGKEHFWGGTSPQFNKSPVSDMYYSIPSNANMGLGTSTRKIPLNEHIAYYKAKYTISDPKCAQDSSVFAYEAFKRLYVDFTKSSSNAERKKLRSYNMLKLKAHKVKWEDGRYMWYAYLREGYFSRDMFYGCDQLQAIALPRNVKVLDYVEVCEDEKQYFASSD